MIKDLICGTCGTKQSTDSFKQAVIYFPARMIYTTTDINPVKCVNCSRDFNMIVFGENSILLTGDLYENTNVIENNQIYQDNKNGI